VVMPCVKSAYWPWSAGIESHSSHFERGDSRTIPKDTAN
jgi:hypothetical protein